ncbi:MAG: DUF6249 domain-containing protein [Pseudomonadota bacterium]
MKKILIATIGLAFLCQIAHAQTEPANAGSEPVAAPATATTEKGEPVKDTDLIKQAKEEGLSDAIVKKLDADQITKILKTRALSRDLSDTIVKKLNADQLTRVLRTRAKMKDRDSQVEIWVPLFFFFFVSLIVASVLYYRFRKESSKHQTLRIMIEKGTQIPPELLTPPVPPKSDLRKGIILLAIGIALCILGALLGETKHVWSIGLLPGLIGCGYLVAWKLESKKHTNNGNQNNL